ncbi:MAG: hypothetical protein J0L88_13020 [Xanthomonadales bacterium]|nr:hypothetical protein [Xanthomonadales bacterium]
MATILRATIRCLAWFAALAFGAPAFALDGVVGPANCDEAGFNGVLAAVNASGGGTITFDCGTATIPFTAYKPIGGAVTIDGRGTITFDGANTSAFFQVFFSANATLRRLTLRRGTFAAAHALENFGALRLERVQVQDSLSAGPTVVNHGTLTVIESMFRGNANTATGLDGDGGAIAHDGEYLYIDASTFAANSAGRHGGAVFSSNVLTIENSTFTGNQAGSGGGAVYQTGSGNSAILQATFADNAAVFGGAIYNDGSASSTLNIRASIMAGNSGGNCDGVLTSGGDNLWFAGTNCPFSATGDGPGNPVLGTLASNGGPTQTRMPGTGSAAIDRISPARCILSMDQRGARRPAGAGCDSGAVEAGAVIDTIFQDGFE